MWNMSSRLSPSLVALTAVIAAGAASLSAQAGTACDRPVYLTFDTGHMGVAPLIADVLKRENVHVTFFAANEPTKSGGSSMDAEWAPWWKARAAEGHEFASHTFDHVYWRGDIAKGHDLSFKVKPSAGPRAGQSFTMTTAQYCEEIRRSEDRLREMTGKPPLPLFRAPGGKTSEKLLAAARSCGYAHVGWAPAGFLGDELPSDRYPNQRLLDQALKNIRSGDILLAHLGIWSRQDPWAPAVLDPLIKGLKERGFCFRTLREHPDYAAWTRRQ
ncbi:MAG: polysaccharide deacetylase family protein [Burkholderiaceae bacterium]|jgi:peptidoglycan/xylan/chitin deacetylase (PgdA/CDA1 family)|nr:polysaccharide deacetylase family protein [Burkholderiaceae bacterium]